MLPDGVLSLAQLTGYLAFALGVYSFLQKDDRRLKAAVGIQAFSYAVHFLLLGSPAAAVASLVTFVRAFTSLYTRAAWVGALFVAANVALGLVTVTRPTGWLPVLASCAGSIAFFWFDGIPMRLVLLFSTVCWLLNNLLLGSIGGTLLELFIGIANVTTVYRLWRARREARSVAESRS